MELRRYIEIIWRRKWLLIQAVLVIAGGALFASSLVTPIYKSSTHILIDTESLQPDYFSQGVLPQLPPRLGKLSYLEPRNVVDTCITLAEGSPVIGRVIKELDLRDSKGRLIEIKDFVITIPRFPKLIIKQKKGVKIKRMKSAEMLEVTGYSSDRQEAAEIANSITQSFSDFLSDLYRKEAASARQAIEKVLLEIEISAFVPDLSRKEIFSTGQSPERSFLESKGERAETGKSEQQFRIRQQAIELDNQVASLIAELAGLEAEKNNLQRLLQKAYSQADTATTITLTARIEVLSQEIDKKNKNISEIVQEPRELIRLISRLQTLQGIYESLKTRLEYVKIAEVMDVSNIVTVQPAISSVNPRNDIYFPKKGLTLVMSLIMGVIFGIFLCFLSEYLDDRIKTTKDVNEKLNQPVLGVIPRIKKGTNIAEKDGDFLGSFWDLRSNMKMATIGKEHKIVSITSATRGEGKSTVVKNLTHTLVESGEKVLLVDLNFRRPCLHSMFNHPNSIGLSNFLKGEKEIKDIILPTTVKGLELIPCGFTFLNPLQIIDSPGMLRLIQSIRENYDWIVFDTPAVQDGSDVRVISSYSDNLIFVVASGHVSEDSLKSAIGIVQKTNLLGVVLNKV